MRLTRTITQRLALAGWIGLALGLPSGPALAALVSYEWNSGFKNGGVIPDEDPNGWSDTRTVSTVYSSIASVSVRLNISGGFNGDLYGYLVHDSGFAILLNRVGKTGENPWGYDDAGFFVTLSDLAGVTTDIHSYGGNGGDPLTGTFQSDGRDSDPDFVLDTDPRTARLTSFNGLNPNGTWTIYFADMAGGEESTVTSWGLELEAVPEPVNVGLAAFGMLVFTAALWHTMQKRVTIANCCRFLCSAVRRPITRTARRLA